MLDFRSREAEGFLLLFDLLIAAICHRILSIVRENKRLREFASFCLYRMFLVILIEFVTRIDLWQQLKLLFFTSNGIFSIKVRFSSIH
jgi:hypothetical protein